LEGLAYYSRNNFQTKRRELTVSLPVMRRALRVTTPVEPRARASALTPVRHPILKVLNASRS
jgi:hypothetical protein